MKDAMTMLKPRTLDAHDETGAVLGWMVITVTAAGLLTILWALAGPVLGELFHQTIGSILSF